MFKRLSTFVQIYKSEQKVAKYYVVSLEFSWTLVPSAERRGAVLPIMGICLFGAGDGGRGARAQEGAGSLRPCSDSSATPIFPSQPEGKIGLPRANPRGRLRSPSYLENAAATRDKPRGSHLLAR